MPIAEFLEKSGWDGARHTPLAGDASARRYLRLAQGRKSAILMDAPPASAGPQTRFVEMADWLRGIGLSAPEILAQDVDQGFLLLEDLGDSPIKNALANQADAARQYAAAIDVLTHIQAQPVPDFLQPYSAEILHEESARLLLWYLPAAQGRAVSPALASDFHAQLDAMLAPILATPPVVILRDYHGENLHWLSDRHGLQRVGLLDFQDALAGHPAYDLASLLGDVRVDMPQDLQRDALVRFVAATGHRDIDREVAILGAQRALKILGLFVRLAVRDGKKGYLALLPRCWHVLLSALQHPDLRPMRQFVRANIPPPGDWIGRI